MQIVDWNPQSLWGEIQEDCFHYLNPIYYLEITSVASKLRKK
jgi:hypothetical protein